MNQVNDQVQKLQDMLAVMQHQRDNALNVVVVVQAENTALKRSIKELENAVEKLKPPAAAGPNENSP